MSVAPCCALSTGASRALQLTIWALSGASGRSIEVSVGHCRWTRNPIFHFSFHRIPVERATRIELAFSAWEADVLPLNYARVVSIVVARKNPIFWARSTFDEPH